MPNSAQMTDPQQVSLNGAFGRKKPDPSRKVWTWINCFAPDNPKIHFEPKDGTNWTFIDESIRDQGDRRRGRIRTRGKQSTVLKINSDDSESDD